MLAKYPASSYRFIAVLATLFFLFTLNNGSASTTSQNVTLNLSTTPASSQMRFSNDGSNRSSWIAYNTSYSRTLSAGTGTKTVYAQFDENGDNGSDLQLSDTIEYDNGYFFPSCAPGAGVNCVNVIFKILTGTSYCTTVNDIDLGQKIFDYNAITYTGNLKTSDIDDYWICEDQDGLADRTVYIQSTSVINMSDPSLNSNRSIPSSNVKITSNQASLTAGSCTMGSYSNNLSSLNTARTIFGKNGAQLEVCKLEVQSPVMLSVITNPSQPIGIYSGTLTITSPF